MERHCYVTRSDDNDTPPKQRSSAHISWVDRIEYAVRSRGAKVVVLALVANTMVAQLLYNSAGQLVLGSAFLPRVSALLRSVLDGGVRLV